MILILASSDVRTAPLPGNEPGRRSRAEAGLQCVFRFPGPSQRLVNAFSTGRRRRPRLYLRRSGYVEHVTSLARHFSSHSVDHVERHASIFPLVGPHHVLQTQTFATVLRLQRVLDGLCDAAANVYPTILSWRIRFKICTLEGFQARAKQSRFLVLSHGVVASRILWF